MKLGSKLKYLNIIRDIINLFDHEDESYYKPVKVDNICSNNYVEYGSYGNRNKTLSVEEYIHKTWPCLKDIRNDLKKSDTWKTQLTIAISFIYSKDNDEERVMH